MSESSESSTDDEERKRLREAVVTDVGGYTYSCNGEGVVKTRVKEPAQARPEDVSDGEEKHPFGTTPEFRAFMRRKLAKHLDSILVYTDSPKNSSVCVKGPPLGDCPLFLGCPDGDEDSLELPPPPLPSRLSNGCDDSSTDSSENDRIAEAAVTCEFLFGNRVLPGFKSNHSKLEEGTKEKKRRKKKKKEKHKFEGTLAETSCAADSSDEESQVECGDSTHRKKRRGSVEAKLSQSCNASSEEPAMQGADFEKKKSKKKRKRRNKEDTEIPSGFDSGDKMEPSDHKKKKKKKRKSVDSVKDESNQGTHLIQTEEQHSCGRGKAGMKNCTPDRSLLQHSVAPGACHVHHKTAATSTVTEASGVQEKDHRNSCRKHRKRRN